MMEQDLERAEERAEHGETYEDLSFSFEMQIICSFY